MKLAGILIDVTPWTPAGAGVTVKEYLFL